jgi:hypothetical protein
MDLYSHSPMLYSTAPIQNVTQSDIRSTRKKLQEHVRMSTDLHTVSLLFSFLYENKKEEDMGGLFFIIILLLVGWDKSLGTAATSGLLYKPPMIDEDDCGAIGGIKISRGNRSTRKKTCPGATLSTTNST